MANEFKAFFDSNAFDWFLDNGQGDALALIATRVCVVTGPEVAFEIRNTPNLDRRADLEAQLALCFPLVPTRLPRAGMARSGLARVATPAGETLHAKLAALPGVRKLDPTHLLNCAAEHCDVFVTDDRKILNKSEILEPLCGFLVRHPEAFNREWGRDRWRVFVDIATVVWLVLFLRPLLVDDVFDGPVVATLSIVLVGVFMADLVVTYRRVGERPARFVRTHWLAIVLVIPYFRIFRIVRVGRALRAVRLLRVGRGACLGGVARAGLNQARAVKKGTRAAQRSNRPS